MLEFDPDVMIGGMWFHPENSEPFLNLGDHPVAKQIYPELFGELPEPDTSVPEDEQRFDRHRVTDIINGGI